MSSQQLLETAPLSDVCRHQSWKRHNKAFEQVRFFLGRGGCRGVGEEQVGEGPAAFLLQKKHKNTRAKKNEKKKNNFKPFFHKKEKIQRAASLQPSARHQSKTIMKMCFIYIMCVDTLQ